MKLLHSFVTPLRYPGGKGRLGVWLAELIQHNGLENGLYVEPYAGGAGAAMFLLANNHVERIAINDLDPVVHAFWWAVLNDTDRLVELVKETPVTTESCLLTFPWSTKRKPNPPCTANNRGSNNTRPHTG